MRVQTPIPDKSRPRCINNLAHYLNNNVRPRIVEERTDFALLEKKYYAVLEHFKNLSMELVEEIFLNIPIIFPTLLNIHYRNYYGFIELYTKMIDINGSETIYDIKKKFLVDGEGKLLSQLKYYKFFLGQWSRGQAFRNIPPYCTSCSKCNNSRFSGPHYLTDDSKLCNLQCFRYPLKNEIRVTMIYYNKK